jgi:hypothetical protein
MLSPNGNKCITIIWRCQEFLCYIIVVDLIERIRGLLLSIRTWIRDVQNALQNHSESDHVAEEIKRGQDFPRQPIRAVVSFDDETIRTTKAEGDRQYGTQNSIKRRLGLRSRQRPSTPSYRLRCGAKW